MEQDARVIMKRLVEHLGQEGPALGDWDTVQCRFCFVKMKGISDIDHKDDCLWLAVITFANG